MRVIESGLLGTIAAVVVLGLSACSGEPRAENDTEPEPAAAAEPVMVEASGEHAGEDGGGEHGTSEHDGDGEHGERGEHGSEGEGEESGEYIARGATWDATRNGARLILSFDVQSGAFVGTVENTTTRTLCAVRVEVHLANGMELGPTERTDVPAGQTTPVRLPAGGEAFETWTAHPEISSCRGA